MRRRRLRAAFPFGDGGWPARGPMSAFPRQAWDSEWPVYYSEGLAAYIRMLPAAARGMDLEIVDDLAIRTGCSGGIRFRAYGATRRWMP